MATRGVAMKLEFRTGSIDPVDRFSTPYASREMCSLIILVKSDATPPKKPGEQMLQGLTRRSHPPNGGTCMVGLFSTSRSASARPKA